MRISSLRWQVIGMEFYVDGANEYKGAFAAMRAAGAQAVVIVPAPELSHDSKELSTIALESGLPSICGQRRYAEQGCLIAYGPNFTELVQRTFIARLRFGPERRRHQILAVKPSIDGRSDRGRL